MKEWFLLWWCVGVCIGLGFTCFHLVTVHHGFLFLFLPKGDDHSQGERSRIHSYATQFTIFFPHLAPVALVLYRFFFFFFTYFRFFSFHEVMTIHKAKGLEFNTVFLTNAVDSRLPGSYRRYDLPVPRSLAKVSSQCCLGVFFLWKEWREGEWMEGVVDTEIPRMFEEHDMVTWCFACSSQHGICVFLCLDLMLEPLHEWRVCPSWLISLFRPSPRHAHRHH